MVKKQLGLASRMLLLLILWGFSAFASDCGVVYKGHEGCSQN